MQCDIEPTDTVAIWGCGPVGQMAIRSAVLLGANQVIAIDRLPERLSIAEAGGATTINFQDESVVERLKELTDGKGPEKCIDCIGTESHVSLGQPDTILDRAKQIMLMENDRPHVLREMIYVCRPGGILSIPLSCQSPLHTPSERRSPGAPNGCLTEQKKSRGGRGVRTFAMETSARPTCRLL